ncbi:hypothetical protein EYZ11_002127 [Aspergillus tanneri]|uniref:Uncharacterized protein n=1 Tax=Aspergillus tanneri TaxID=1220188 RepID=A0A4S3JTC9_9EURO|nr:hypothetical protein EYZ11_002127 [Aspergillus tanneri]
MESIILPPQNSFMFIVLYGKNT